MNNDNLVLIGGVSGGGKSASLRNIPNPEGVLFLNCEAGKKLPFKSKFIERIITDPFRIHAAFDACEPDHENFNPKFKGVHTIVIDTITFMMEMFESQYCVDGENTMKGWQHYQQFFKNLMQDYVARSTKNVIMLAHVMDVYNEGEQLMETKVPVKGALKQNGIEAYFSTVVTARKIAINKLADYTNELLTISPEEEALGYKWVFQTKITKDTVNHRIRSSMGMWSIAETFIDNDADLVLKRLHHYYG